MTKMTLQCNTHYLAIPNPALKIDVAQVMQNSVEDHNSEPKYVTSLAPIKTLPRPVVSFVSVSPTILIKTRIKAVGTDSKKISMTPIFEKWFILIFEA